MILGFFPKKAAFPPFFRHSRPEAGRAAVLKCAAFLPPKKLRQKEMSAGRRCSHSTGCTACPLPSLPENGGDFGENKARRGIGAVTGHSPPQWEISSKAALWGGMADVAVRRYGASVPLPLPEPGRFRREQGQAKNRGSGSTPSLRGRFRQKPRSGEEWDP